ncbi:hypothetical protein Scep_009585 [Stephania cephalantha]|uniref:Oberon PHD finger domain-containing protein n=1 Tax=Stephania cephalantha TaxID=152367 RepID=A0AAP0JU45_9MAGN
MDLENLVDNSSPVVGLNYNGLILRPVEYSESGEGLPYAPVDWPNPGDVWTWTVGRRKTNKGFMVDRILSLPKRLCKPLAKKRFASKCAVKEYIKKEFPNADINAFFASFSWKIPSKDHFSGKDKPIKEESGSGPDWNSRNADCKIGNRTCKPYPHDRSNSLPVMDCNICCSEPGFCRGCCCILCCKTIDQECGGYTFIRCEARVNEHYICGHVAHLECAIRSHMAGTVGGSVGLDAEYYCRRCDMRTNLISRVSWILRICRRLDSRDEIEKTLSMGLSILQGSQQESATSLLKSIEVALEKLKNGACVQELWNVEDDSTEFSDDTAHSGNNEFLPDALEDMKDSTTVHEFRNTFERSQPPLYITSEHKIESLKLDHRINKVLQELRHSQEQEYRTVEESLHAQKDYILGLFQELDSERSELARCSSLAGDSNADAFLTSIMNKMNQIKREVLILKDMEGVSKGFAKVPKGILKEHFGLEIED